MLGAPLHEASNGMDPKDGCIVRVGLTLIGPATGICTPGFFENGLKREDSAPECHPFDQVKHLSRQKNKMIRAVKQDVQHNSADD